MTDNAIWYMRDNHTFKRLSLNVGEAVEQMRAEFDAGWTHGMLCTSSLPVGNVHAHGGGRWQEFEIAARKWYADLSDAFDPCI